MPKTNAGARWRALIEEFTGSGESVATFCTRRGLAIPTFYQWRRRLASSEGPAPFLPVRVVGSRPPSAPVSSGVEVVLRGGRRLRLERDFDAAVLTAAVAALEGAAC